MRLPRTIFLPNDIEVFAAVLDVGLRMITFRGFAACLEESEPLLRQPGLDGIVAWPSTGRNASGGNRSQHDPALFRTRRMSQAWTTPG